MAVLKARAPHVASHGVEIDGLPAALDGLKVVQLTDLHCGPFVSEERVDGWVARANELDADVVALTGDFVAWGGRYVKAVARALGKLRARRGVFACMGNHDYFGGGAGDRLVSALEAQGIEVLRNRSRALGDGLVVAGVDDAWTRRADLARALAGIDGWPLLLCHDPALFPRIARAGVPLTLSGHTHAGQFAVPFVAQLNLAALITRYTAGFYREGASVLYVSSGLGTTGPPLRIGTRAEIVHLTLRRR
jgi:predicted MPP superfamily phosphohydrolase